jgi:hypothetical protein
MANQLPPPMTDPYGWGVGVPTPPGVRTHPLPRTVHGVRGHQLPGVVGNPGIAGTVLGRAVTGAPPVQNVQQFLVSRGYNIPVDGKMGALTKAALNDFHLNPKARNPKQFNQKYGLAKGGARTSIVDKPLTGKGGLLDSRGNMSPSYAAASAAGGDPGGQPIDLTSLVKLAATHGIPVSESLLSQLSSPDTTTPLDSSFADKLAGLQFDSKIGEIRRSKSQQGAQGAQDLEDIKNWYDQVAASQGTAAARDKAASAAGVSSLGDAVKNIVASLGGSANEGAGLVGAAGADNVGLLSALAANQDTYNADIAPLLKAEGASAAARQVVRNANDAKDIEGQLTDQLGLRGDAKSKALMDIQQYNDQGKQTGFQNALSLLAQKLGIKQYNNSVHQQDFQNRLALEQAKEAAQLTGAKVITALNKPGASKLPHGAFHNASAQTKTSVANAVAAAVLGPDGKVKPGLTPAGARARAVNIVRASGWHPQANVETNHWLSSVLAGLGI